MKTHGAFRACAFAALMCACAAPAARAEDGIIFHEKFTPPLRLDGAARRFGRAAEGATNDFTVSMWVRPLAFGEKALARDWPNGMLCSNGSGYFDGWRVLAHDTNRWQVVFEIGRAEGAASVVSESGLRPGAWHHISASWEARPRGAKTGVMRLYIDGWLEGERADAPAPLKPGADFAVGYVDFGVGSMLADFGEVTVRGGAEGGGAVRTLPRAAGYAQDAASATDRAEMLGLEAMRLERIGGAAALAEARGIWRAIADDPLADERRRKLARQNADGAKVVFPDAERRPAPPEPHVTETIDRAFTIPWTQFTRGADGVWSAPAPAEHFELSPFGVGESKRDALMVFTDGGRLLKPARWPDEGFVKCTNVIDKSAGVIALDFERARRWTRGGARGAFAHGYWRYTWADAGLPAEIITHGGAPALRLAKAHGYGLGDAPYFQVWNLREELDSPGEYFYDKDAGRLLLIPPEGAEPGAVKIARGAEPLQRIENQDGATVIGKVFTGTRGDAALVKNSRGVVFRDCIFRGIGGAALVAEGAPGLRVENCVFENIGHHALIVEAGERRTLTPGGAVVTGCAFSRAGQMQRTYTPGVLVYGVGALIERNIFTDMPSSALRVEGNDHIVRGNWFERLVLESDDQGAVDMWGDPSYRGCVFSGNVFRDIGRAAGAGAYEHGSAAIRLDDAISGVEISGNVFVNASKGSFGAVQIHGGKDNIILQNHFMDCALGVSFSPWGAERWRRQLTENREITDKITKAVDIAKPPFATRYPDLAALLENADCNGIFANRFTRCPLRFKSMPPNTVLIWNGR